MREWFGELGEVVHVRIAEDYETGKRKGFAHVEFATPEAALKAVEYNGEVLDGRPIRIDISAPRPRAPLDALLILSHMSANHACATRPVHKNDHQSH
jgi:RNA recognition motif-containing protein